MEITYEKDLPLASFVFSIEARKYKVVSSAQSMQNLSCAIVARNLQFRKQIIDSPPLSSTFYSRTCL